MSLRLFTSHWILSEIGHQVAQGFVTNRLVHYICLSSTYDSIYSSLFQGSTMNAFLDAF